MQAAVTDDEAQTPALRQPFLVPGLCRWAPSPPLSCLQGESAQRNGLGYEEESDSGPRNADILGKV